MNQIKKLLKSLAEEAKGLGISKETESEIEIYLRQNEYDHLLHMLTNELFDKQLSITQHFYDTVITTANLMSLSEESYDFLRSLIKDGTNLMAQK